MTNGSHHPDKSKEIVKPSQPKPGKGEKPSKASAK